MKQMLRSLTMLIMVVTCSMMVSCSNEDGDETGGGGDKAIVVNGKVSKLNHGYWEADEGEVHMYFSNVDMLNMSSLPKKVEMLTMNIEGKATSIQTGTHRAYIEFWSMNPVEETYNGSAYGNVNVVITKNGSEYTVTIPETTVRYVEGDGDEDNSKPVPFTFKYTGRMLYYYFD